VKKWFEKKGRQILEKLLECLFAVKRPTLPVSEFIKYLDCPRILVVRIDQRVGNLLLLTPLLDAIKFQWPQAQISVLCQYQVASVLMYQPSIDKIIKFDKKSFFSSYGWGCVFYKLRQTRFDIAINAGNPLGDTFTHPFVTRFCGARYLVGPHKVKPDQVKYPTWLYHAAVWIEPHWHEMHKRLALIAPLLGLVEHELIDKQIKTPQTPCYANAATLQQLTIQHQSLILQINKQCQQLRTVVVIIGARLENKRLNIEDWRDICELLKERRFSIVVVFGPKEVVLAQALFAQCPFVVLAPPTSLEECAALMYQAFAVIGCDTGLSHLAVAVNKRVLVIFLDTDPQFYGYQTQFQRFIDARHKSQRTSTIKQAINSFFDGSPESLDLVR